MVDNKKIKTFFIFFLFFGGCSSPLPDATKKTRESSLPEWANTAYRGFQHQSLPLVSKLHKENYKTVPEPFPPSLSKTAIENLKLWQGGYPRRISMKVGEKDYFCRYELFSLEESPSFIRALFRPVFEDKEYETSSYHVVFYWSKSDGTVLEITW